MSVEVVGEFLPVVRDSMKKYKGQLKKMEKKMYSTRCLTVRLEKIKSSKKKKDKSWNQGTQLN